MVHLIVSGDGVYWLIYGISAFVAVLMTYFLIIYHPVFFVVAANGVLSSQCPIRSGVPQGGIWSPLLFDLYIRELPRLIRHSSILCYADDITLFQRIPRICHVQCAAGLNADLQSLLSYGASWLLVFEPSKTQVLTVSNRRDPFSNPSVVMNGTPVVESDSLKFLGYI